MPPMPSPDQIEQAKLVAEACSWEEISAILRSDDRRNYTIDIETDATAFEDEEVEKQQRIEFVRAITEMMMAWVPAIGANPTFAPFAKELAVFASGAFKAGRSFEEALGDAFDQIKNMPPQPNPEMEKIKAEMTMAREKHAMEMEKGQTDLAGKQQAAQIQVAGKQADIQAKQQSTEMDMHAKQLDLQLKELTAKLDIALKQMEMGMKREELGIKREEMQLDRQQAHEEHALKREDMYVQHDMQQEQHKMDREQAVFEHGMERQTAQDRREEQKIAFKDKQAMMKKQAAAKKAD